MSEVKSSLTRKFGIDLVGDIAWGTHLCQFYHTKKDLVDILVPYFAEGLRSNEFCMWVTSPPLRAAEARRALRKVVSDLDERIEKGQIEILSYEDWYLLDGEFDANRVLQGWVDKEKNALEKGFEGLRLSGNTFWIERNCWKSFTDYEAMINDVIGLHRMIALCTYSLRKCTGNDVIDVERNHIGTLIRKGETWNLVEDVSERIKAERALRASERKYRSLFENMMDGFALFKVTFDDAGNPVDSVFSEVNDAFEKLTGLKREDVVGKRAVEVFRGLEKDPAGWIGKFSSVVTSGKPIEFEDRLAPLDRWYSGTAYCPEAGYIVATFHEITDRKRMEETSVRERDMLRGIMENTGTMMAYFDSDFNFLAVNSAYAKGSGHNVEDLIGKNHFALFPNAENQAVFEKARSTGELVTFFDKPFEFAGQPERGVTYWDWTLAPVKDQAGRVQGLVLSLLETTHRKRAEEEIKSLSRFPAENPNVVMRISKEGTILYCNNAGLLILNEWKCQVGQAVPSNWRQLVADSFSAGARKEFEEEYDTRTFLVMLAPIVDAGYVNVYGRDITERKKAEERILLAKNEWERTFDSMPDLIAIIDKEHKIVRANKSMAQRLGLSPDRCVGLDCFSCFHKLGGPPSFCPHSLTLADGKEHVVELHEDSLKGDFLVSTSPLLDQSGQVIGSIHVARDITESKRAEQELQESQKDLNRAQSVAKTGSWRLDVHRNQLLWSDETYRMFGIPKGKPLAYEDFLGTVHPDDREFVDQRWQAALRGEPYDIEHRIVANGEVVWVREKAELEFSKDRALLGGFGTVQDVTERRQIQDKLFQSERKYRTLYETTLDGIVSVDLNGRITECNDAYANMLGYSKDELRNMTYLQLTPERWHQKDEEITGEQVMKRGYSDLFEKEYFRKDGSVFPISIRVWLIRDEKWKPAGMWGIVRDITRSKQLENELKRYSEHLERLVEERTRKLKDAERLATIGETAAMVGHDIRNPLQTVEGAIYLAKEEIKALPSRTREINNVEEMLNAIHEETTYVNKIVSDLQDYARPLAPQLEETDTKRLINGALTTMQIPSTIEVSVTVDQDCCTLVVDPTMMKRILANLITNALQAMPNGGKLTIAAFKKQDEVHISVQDTGQGIPDENRAKIFQPLFSTKAKGQGFGLAVVKRLVEAHRGTITFATEIGRGTAFMVAIPLVKEAN